jgi:hypothetical protein
VVAVLLLVLSDDTLFYTPFFSVLRCSTHSSVLIHITERPVSCKVRPCTLSLYLWFFTKKKNSTLLVLRTAFCPPTVAPLLYITFLPLYICFIPRRDTSGIVCSLFQFALFGVFFSVQNTIWLDMR